MDNLNEIRVRIKADTSSFDNPIDVFHHEIPQFWRGNDVRFEIGVFHGNDILSVSNYSSISLAIRSLTEDGKVPSASTPALMQKVCTELNGSVTAQTWSDGSEEHAALSFSSDESNVPTGNHWLSIWATTSDATPKIVTLCAGIISILEVGGGNSSIPPDPIALYYTADESDGRFVQLSAIDTNPDLGQSNSMIPSQKAVKSYVNAVVASVPGEANTASNLGSGAGIFKEKSGVDLAFKSLMAGSNISISANSSAVTISASSGGSGSGMTNPMVNIGDLIVGGAGGMAIRLERGSSGQILKSTGEAIEWADSTSDGLENPMISADDIIVGGDGGAPLRLAKGTDGQVLKTTAGGVQWSDEDTYVLPLASSSTLGGIKVGDRLSVDGDGILSADAQDYTLPAASSSTLGGIKVGDRLSVDSGGVLSADAQNYTLPAASSSTLGGIKVGNRLSVDSGGVLSADAQNYTLPAASSSTLGGIKVGNRLSVDSGGVLSADAQNYTLPAASSSTLGGIKVGNRLSVDSDGILSADAQSYTLPTASSTTLGGIRPDGTTLTVDSSTGIASAVSSGGGGSSMAPSSQVVTLTVGSSGSSYVAPADGWVVVSTTTTSTNASVRLEVKDDTGTTSLINASETTYSSGRVLQTFVPVASANVVILTYEGVSFQTFRFVYSQGAI